jgi:RNA polymerase sigma-70 factor (ECF subfamily)
LAIDFLRSARARRETYVGEWLPEPLHTDHDPARSDSERAESISMAFLVLLQRLSAVERAVFLLHDVFGHDYAEIAGIVGKSEEHCRQLALRARKHIDEGRPRFEPSLAVRDDLARRFFAAIASGNSDALLQLLAKDAIVYGDGGGKAPQWPRPISGQARVADLLSSVGSRLRDLGGQLSLREVNGQPGALVFDREARLINVFTLDISGGVVQTVRSVINPDKLRHLGPLADIYALLRQRT